MATSMLDMALDDVIKIKGKSSRGRGGGSDSLAVGGKRPAPIGVPGGKRPKDAGGGGGGASGRARPPAAAVKAAIAQVAKAAAAAARATATAATANTPGRTLGRSFLGRSLLRNRTPLAVAKAPVGTSAGVVPPGTADKVAMSLEEMIEIEATKRKRPPRRQPRQSAQRGVPRLPVGAGCMQKKVAPVESTTGAAKKGARRRRVMKLRKEVAKVKAKAIRGPKAKAKARGMAAGTASANGTQANNDWHSGREGVAAVGSRRSIGQAGGGLWWAPGAYPTKGDIDAERRRNGGGMYSDWESSAPKRKADSSWWGPPLKQSRVDNDCWGAPPLHDRALPLKRPRAGCPDGKTIGSSFGWGHLRMDAGARWEFGKLSNGARDWGQYSSRG